MLLSQ
jgi:tRNA A37 threonylcarbamoyltransferase TsaD